MRLTVLTTPMEGLTVVDMEPLEDGRGTFARLFCGKDLGALLQGRHIAQINHSRNNMRGTVRGLHFQYPPHAEMKFVRCLKGRVWDVAVDLRRGSPTFLRWHAEELSGDNRRMLVIPEGCAHGYQVLEPDSELLYLHTAVYSPAAEGSLAVDDPRLSISWPLPVEHLSDKDRRNPPITADFRGIPL